MVQQQNIQRYLEAVGKYRTMEAREERLLLLFSLARLIIFFGGLVVLWFGFTRNTHIGILLLLVVIIAFLGMVKIYSFHTGRKNFLNNLAIINQNEANALEGDISAFNPGSSYINIHHDFSWDVDLFGKKSLFQYLNRTVTEYGRDILAEWLSDPYALSDEVISRQQIIEELAGREKWRHEFMATGMGAPLEKKEISSLLEWMAESSSISSSRVKIILLYLLPLAATVTFILAVTGLLAYQVFTLIFLINLFQIAAGLKSSNRIHIALTKRNQFLQSLKGLLEVFKNEDFESSELKRIRSGIAGNIVSADIAVKKLGDLIQAFDSRINMIAGVLLNGMFMWDYQCIYRLEKWKAENRDLFPTWLEMAGRIDAYISLGNYAFNNPGYVYPEISDASSQIDAKDLGHQLLDETRRVCNDFYLGSRGTVCIITGANMAGKSTFLRTVAINYILAMAGAPVCASKMSFCPARLFTSMRTTDSLSDNESYFYAELKRLKLLKSKVENGEPVFIILDEILKGTNSEDKSAGSKLFLLRIVDKGGTGLIATHDTSLGKMEEERPGKVINKCFEIEIDGQNIRFDYKLHEGITQKMNAVFLMKQMKILE